MVGLRSLFRGKQIESIFNKFDESVHNDILRTLQFVGEEFVNNARLKGNYKDQTSNLRSSIGYIILLDGKVIQNNFSGNREGQSNGKKVAKEVSQKYPEGYVLIGVAGMNYAAYVEAKNLDVISGSAPELSYLKSLLDEI